MNIQSVKEKGDNTPAPVVENCDVATNHDQSVEEKKDETPAPAVKNCDTAENHDQTLVLIVL